MEPDNPQGFGKEDPFEAIFALNMGDFVTEHLISDDLLSRISQTMVQDPQRLKKQLEELVQIYSLNNTLSLLGFRSSQGFVLYDSMAMSLNDMFQSAATHILLRTETSTHTTFLSLAGSSIAGLPTPRWTMGYDLSEPTDLLTEAFFDDYPMVVDDLADMPGWTPLDVLNQHETQSLIAVPLHHGNQRLGLLLFEWKDPQDFAQEAIELAESTARVFVASITLQDLLDKAQMQIGLETPDVPAMRSLRAQLTESIGDLGRYQQFFLESLADAIDARHDFTQGHSRQVAHIARRIAEAMGLNEKTVDLVYFAGLLGALGKIHVPQDILTKEETLTEGEWDTLRNSPNMGVGLLMKMNFMAEVIPYVDYQKERWDGQNSPHGLSGKSIPLGARIIAVADAYHALTQPRPYREKVLSTPEAVQILQSESGTKWDPDVVAHLARMAAESAL